MSMPTPADSGKALDLDAIRARVDAATEGPWEWSANSDDRFFVTGGGEGAAVNIEVDSHDGNWSMSRQRMQADAQFIATARTDVPALLDEVERLRPVAEAAAAVVAVLRGKGWKPENEWFIPETAPFVAAVEAWRGGGGS